MRSVHRPAVGGACLIAAIAAAACARGGGTAPGQPSPAAAPAARTAAMTPIDTVGLPRVRFAQGTTSGILDDSLAAGATRSYLVGARQGQVMLAHAIAWPVAERLHPPPEPVVRVFAAATGRELPSPRAEPEVWSARLPEDGDYVVRVTASARTTYTLAVQIPRQVQVSADQPTAIFTGVTPSRAPIDYLIRAEAGRTLEIVLGGAPTVGLHVYGLGDGVQLARLADRQRLYAGRVATTQDYVVSVVPGAERAAFDLRITLR
jgi:hypothetical protein